jgi:hypothetical protein
MREVPVSPLIPAKPRCHLYQPRRLCPRVCSRDPTRKAPLQSRRVNAHSERGISTERQALRPHSCDPGVTPASLTITKGRGQGSNTGPSMGAYCIQIRIRRHNLAAPTANGPRASQHSFSFRRFQCARLTSAFNVHASYPRPPQGTGADDSRTGLDQARAGPGGLRPGLVGRRPSPHWSPAAPHVPRCLLPNCAAVPNYGTGLNHSAVPNGGAVPNRDGAGFVCFLWFRREPRCNRRQKDWGGSGFLVDLGSWEDLVDYETAES